MPGILFLEIPLASSAVGLFHLGSGQFPCCNLPNLILLPQNLSTGSLLSSFESPDKLFLGCLCFPYLLWTLNLQMYITVLFRAVDTLFNPLPCAGLSQESYTFSNKKIVCLYKHTDSIFTPTPVLETPKPLSSQKMRLTTDQTSLILYCKTLFECACPFFTIISLSI